MLRDLLVHVESSDAAPGFIKFAVDVARRSGSRLTGIHVSPPADLSPIYKPSHVVQASARLVSQLALRAEAAAAIFNAEATTQFAGAAWVSANGDVAKAISAEARYCDLVIIGQYDWQDPAEAHPLPVAHSVVLQCGRPVVVVPANVSSSIFANVVIAWDGSREAVRAVHDALPLMQLAKTTTILSLKSDSATQGTLEASRLVKHLARHDITAKIVEQKVTISEEHSQLHQLVTHGNYDLMVMGAYSHPRWFEFVFGGATESILLSSAIPVLVSH